VADVTVLSLVNNLRPGEWDGILAHTRDMLKAARAGDWDRVIPLERERHARIAQFFSSAPAPHEAAWVRSGIIEILESDEHLLMLCQTRRDDASSGIVDLHRKAAANQAYARTAAG
jgi:hypothetical protein